MSHYTFYKVSIEKSTDGILGYGSPWSLTSGLGSVSAYRHSYVVARVGGWVLIVTTEMLLTSLN